MKTKQWAVASAAVFISIFVLEFIIHGIFLKGLYQQTSSLWRPHTEMQSLMWLMWLGYAIFAPIFVWIYSKGREANKSGLGQGLRFGLALGIAVSAMTSLGWYAVLPIPGALAMGWFWGGVIEFTAAGLVAGLLYQ